MKSTIIPLLFLTLGASAGTFTVFGIRNNDQSILASTGTDTITFQNETFSEVDTVTTITFEAIGDFNGNGTSSLADDGYVTLSLVIDYTERLVEDTDIFFKTLATNLVSISYSIDDSNVIGESITTSFRNPFQFTATTDQIIANTANSNFTEANFAAGTGTSGNRYNLDDIDGWDSTDLLSTDRESGYFTLLGASTGSYEFRDFILGFNVTATDSVPEPTSVALLGLGGLALIARRRR